MRTISVDDNTAEFLLSLMRLMETQDSHGTGRPYYYVVRCQKEIAVPEGTTDNVKYYDREGACTYTPEELRDFCTENGEDFDTYVEQHCVKYDVDTADVYENVFFTLEAYHQHMKLNGHNYRHYKSVSPYILHAFRNPEMEALHKAILEIGHSLEGSRS